MASSDTIGGFSFEEEASDVEEEEPEPSCQATQPASAAAGTKNSKRGNVKAEPDSLLCVVCREPRVSNKTKYCVAHKRCADSIYREASRDKTSPSWKAYQEIFKDEVRANKVLADFLEQNPDGKAKRGERRGFVNWGEYSHSFKTGTITQDNSHYKKMDYEAFVKLMEHVRGWSQQRAHREWEVLQSNPDIQRDMAGPREYPLRLYVPGSITASDEVVQCRFAEESKSASKGIKPKNGGFTDADFNSVKGELNKGMSSGFASSSALSSNFQEVLPQTALTADFGGKALSVSDILLAAVGIKVQEGYPSNPSPSKAGSTQPPAVQLPDVPTKRRKFDIVSMRANANAKLTRDILKLQQDMQGQCEKVASEVIRADKDKDKIYLDAVLERCVMTWLFLGKRPKCPTDLRDIEDITAWTVEAQKLNIERGQVAHAQDQTFYNTVHQEMLQAALKKASLLPVENVDKLECISLMRSRAEKVLQCHTPEDLESLIREFDNCKMLATQLRDSVRLSLRDLLRQIARREAETKAMGERQRKEQEELDRKAAKAVATQASKKPKAVKVEDSVFQVEFAKHPMQTYESDDVFFEDKSQSYEEPFLVINSKLIKDAMLAEACEFASNMQKFGTQFPASAAAKKDYRVSAPLLPIHGIEVASGLLSRFLPPKTVSFLGKDSIVSRTLDTIWFYGYTPELRRVAAEPGHLAILRLQVAGISTIVAASTSSLKVHVAKKLKCPESKFAYSAIINFMNTLTDESLTAAVDEGAHFSYAAVPPHSVIMVPAGFVTGVKTANSANVYGIRQSFITSTPMLAKNLTAVKECLMEQGTPTATSEAQVIDTILKEI